MTWTDNQIKPDGFRNGEFNVFIASKPKPSEWVCHLSKDIKYHPKYGEEPGWFHRKLMHWLFGFRWEKIK